MADRLADLDFRGASDAYVSISVGNQPWLIGVSQVGIHERAAREKVYQGKITHVLNEINITCLPADLPEFIEVDLTGLKKGTSFHLSDVKLPNGVKAMVKGRENPVLVSVVAVAGAEVPAADAAAAPAAGKAGSSTRRRSKTRRARVCCSSATPSSVATWRKQSRVSKAKPMWMPG